MPRTALVPFTPPNGYPATPLTAGIAKLPLVAADATASPGGNSVVMSGQDIIVASNPTVGALTLTIASAIDDKKRKGDITTYNIPAGETHVFGPFPLLGWAQTSDANNLYLNASGAGLLLAVIKFVPAT